MFARNRQGGNRRVVSEPGFETLPLCTSQRTIGPVVFPPAVRAVPTNTVRLSGEKTMPPGISPEKTPISRQCLSACSTGTGSVLADRSQKLAIRRKCQVANRVLLFEALILLLNGQGVMDQAGALLDDRAVVGRESNRKRLTVAQNQPFPDTITRGLSTSQTHRFCPNYWRRAVYHCAKMRRPKVRGRAPRMTAIASSWRCPRDGSENRRWRTRDAYCHG